MARSAGKKPAAIPTKTANTRDGAASHSGMIESEQKTLGYVQAVLGGIGAVSLFVAAIGITNTMMMSIYERTMSKEGASYLFRTDRCKRT